MSKAAVTKVGTPRVDRTKASSAIISELHKHGYISINSWEDGGHIFELLCQGKNRLIVQVYPRGDGFEVWKPLCESNVISETLVAAVQYGKL